MNINTGPSLIHTNIFFVDIVGLSYPTISTRNQIRKIEMLNMSVTDCASFRSTPRDSLLVLPTGDGMAIAFLQGPELPLNLAIELHEKLAKYNRAKIPSETVRVRIGIHSGNVYIVKDILNNRNIWGPGIIVARRIMDIGDDGHILLSARTAEDLRELSDHYKQIVKPLHDYIIKHGQNLLIYSAYGRGFGNSKAPAGDSYQRSKMTNETSKLTRTAMYPYIEVNIFIKDPKTMMVRYKRVYQIQNISDKPIYEVLHGIATDVERTFDELNIKIYDEDGKDLKISSINVDKPYQKEFSTVFNRSIKKEDKGRYYVLEYEVEELERYFENYFEVDCLRFVVNLNYPLQINDPTVYDVNLENNEIKRCRTQPVIKKTRKEGRKLARWTKRDIIRGRSFRFEWK